MPAPLATTGWRRAAAACALGAGTVTMTAAAASATPGDPATTTAPGGGSTAVFQTSQCTPTGQTMGVDLTNLSAVSHAYTITTNSGPATPAGAQLASGGHTYLQITVPRTARAVFVHSSGELVGSLALTGCATSESPTAMSNTTTQAPLAPSTPSTVPSEAFPQRSATRQDPTKETTSPAPEASATSSDAGTSSATASRTPTTTAPATPAATALPTENGTKDPGSNSLLKGFGIGVAVLGIGAAGAVLFREFKK